jgi:hypothetical protein
MKDLAKQISTGFLALLIVFSFASSADAREIDWNKFSNGLNTALQSSKIGLQKSAMRLVIKYGGENLNLKESLDAVIALYEEAPDAETRELAILTIFQINRKRAINLVLKDLETETGIKRHLIDEIRAKR